MQLDMPTISAVAISVTAIIGIVLIFAWWREPTSPLTGWWGLAQLVMCVGIVFALIAAGTNDANLHAFGQAWIILSASLMWMAARQFEGRKLHPFWIFGWPAGILHSPASRLSRLLRHAAHSGLHHSRRLELRWPPESCRAMAASG